LPIGEFDLVHARLLVEHIGTGALPNLLAGVRPGGRLVIEDYDFLSQVSYPPDRDRERVADAVLDLMAATGFDRECGRKLPSELEALGLEDVQAEGRVRLIRGGTPAAAFSRLSVESLRDALVNSRGVDPEEIEAALAYLADVRNTFLSPLLLACHGRRSDRSC
jgi:hypothetical protein